MQFHPDKHAHSPKQVKDTATLKFKQLSEAYETLTDDRKRADYNIGRREAGNSSSSANYRSGAYAGSRYGYEYNNFGYGYSGYAASGRGKNSGATLHFEGLLRLFTMGTFLRNVAFAGVLIGGMYWIDAGRDALWNMKNSGLNFNLLDPTSLKAFRSGEVNWLATSTFPFCQIKHMGLPLETQGRRELGAFLETANGTEFSNCARKLGFASNNLPKV
ncbi:hypothetical protein ACH5RR_012949 [Cinchona calisaya]|uniref:J domain-containing protein n=1 Tax=Cinchona calisaya TaxID=153742 RepID=A0ABD2ZYT0_9GENT